jgi:diacylglycerol O-acyltransferase / wax synthase
MKQKVLSPNMSATDAAFLYLERKEVPLNIASLCIFDAPIPFQKFLANINSKLHMVPRYLQIPKMPSWDLEFPTWQDDPKFDIRRHVFAATLPPPGGEAELQELVSRILSQLLDRNKPLWDVHVVDGLKDGQGAIILRVHHALADGLSGAELMKLLLDPSPEVPESYPKPQYRKTRVARVQQSTSDTLSAAVSGTMGRFLQFEAGVLALAENIVGGQKQSTAGAESVPSHVKGLLGLLPEFTASIERLPFNKPCTGQRRFSWTEFEMADVLAIREAVGGTVNDVILAVLTRALGHYVKEHGESVVNRFVRVVCPVNLRAPGERNGMGNQISFLPVALPLDAHGPVRTLQAVTARTETLKRSGALSFVGAAAKWFSAAPPPLQALFWRTIPEVILPVPLLNMICTNVVGSPTPLYAVGRRMLAAYPQVPTGWDLGVGCAAHSYDGKLFFGLIADTHAAPDVDRLRDFLVFSFEELRRSAAKKNLRRAEKVKHAAPPQEEQAEKPVPTAAPESTSTEPPVTGARVTDVAGHSKEAA